MMGNKHANDITVQATVIDEDAMRYGGSAFKREHTCQLEECSWDNGQRTWGCRCTTCGCKFERTRGTTWRHCPNCGARVVNE